MTNDLGVTAKVSRPLVGGGDLDINDRSKFILAGPITFGGAVAWQRRSIGAPYVDGEITVERHRSNSTDSLGVYVLGSTLSELDTNMGTLIAAMQQDRYTFQLQVGGSNHAWDCEAADIQNVLYDTAHVHNKIVTITFSIPHKPIPLAGSF